MDQHGSKLRRWAWPIGLYLVLAVLFAASAWPVFVDTLPMWSEEEQVNGNLAKDLLDGPVAPLIDYRYQDWTTGQLLIGFALYPLYTLFGDYITVIRLVGVAFSLATFLLWFAFLRRYAGWWAALAGAVLFLAPPPIYSHYITITYANHKESAFFTILLFVLLYRLLETEKARVLPLAIGLSAGFGTFFCLQVLVSTIAVLLVWLGWRQRDRLWGELGLFAAGFGLGFLPLAGWFFRAGVDFLPVGEPGAAELGPWLKVQALVTEAWPLSLYMPDRSANFSYFFIFLAAIGLAVVVNRRELAAGVGRFLWRESATDKAPPAILIVGLYLLLFVVAYGFGIFQVEVVGNLYWARYLTPLYPVMFATVALACARRRPWAGVMLTVVAVGLCVQAQHYDVKWKRASELTQHGYLATAATAAKGHLYIAFLDGRFAAGLAQPVAEGQFAPVLVRLDNVTPEYRWKAWEVFGRAVGRAGEGVDRDGLTVSTVYRGHFLRGWAAGHLEFLAGIPKDRPEFVPAEFEAAAGEPALVPYLWEGVGVRLQQVFLTDGVLENTRRMLAGEGEPPTLDVFRVGEDVWRKAPAACRAAVLKGVGYASPNLHFLEKSYLVLVDGLFGAPAGEDLWAAFYCGAGARLATDVAVNYYHFRTAGLLFQPAGLSDERWTHVQTCFTARLDELGYRHQLRGDWTFFAFSAPIQNP
jgi:MFS family permease